MPKQFRLKGSSLEAIRDKAVAQYGAGARIVAAEKVTNPGFGGLFAKDRFEATVEVPDGAASAGVGASVQAPLATATPAPGTAANAHAGLRRPAIAALLEQADQSELRLHGRGGGHGAASGSGHVPSAAAQAVEPVEPVPVSTARADFAGLLAQLGAEYGKPLAAVEPSLALPAGAPGEAVGQAKTRPKAPAPLTGAGDLVLLLGLGDDALGPALEMSLAAGGCDVRTSGKLTAFGHLHVADRQGATAARASAVATGQAVLLAFGLGSPRDVAGHAAVIASLGADQAWVVADARRKTDDTAAWLTALRNLTAVDALAVVGSQDTLTPGTVHGLGLPVGWLDGRKVD
ncbi:hypothetical protein DC347_10320 [Pseudarthrobacter sp. AG30]|uniref:hypothetical protein n=1 Tax=Pseudarthrobacter sp. AG30 TaxID=2249742 RepID=UPI000D643D02|nr:hypothetical protein [Pseudarthrobacter sp. AG30]RAX17004.1 hypothetical protein DC347_10320 [Pseudarthrobacter sp. AG30]